MEVWLLALPALSGSWQSSPISGSWCFIAIVGCLRTLEILRGLLGSKGSNFLPLGIHSRNALAKFGLRDELLCRSLLPPLLRRITEKSKWEETSGKHPLGEALGIEWLGEFLTWLRFKGFLLKEKWIQWILTKVLKDVDGRNPAPSRMYETPIMGSPDNNNPNYYSISSNRMSSDYGLFPMKTWGPIMEITLFKHHLKKTTKLTSSIFKVPTQSWVEAGLKSPGTVFCSLIGSNLWANLRSNRRIPDTSRLGTRGMELCSSEFVRAEGLLFLVVCKKFANREPPHNFTQTWLA